jgi:hypothetical protein
MDRNWFDFLQWGEGEEIRLFFFFFPQFPVCKFTAPAAFGPSLSKSVLLTFI